MNLFASNINRGVHYTYVKGVVYFWSTKRKKWMPTRRPLSHIKESTTLVGKMLHMKFGMQHIQF